MRIPQDLQAFQKEAHEILEKYGIERSPRAFAGMKEEDLRLLLLVPLNGHFEGQATGETFNGEGKTDILIRERNKNIFIAECKFWHGAKSFTEAIDQLQRYTTWRGLNGIGGRQ